MQRINYGMPTLIETSTLDECAKLCAELGLDFIELNMNMPQYQLGKRAKLPCGFRDKNY